jgi:hypothetical protein
MNEQIAELRRLIYHIGVVLITLGFLMILGTLFHVFSPGTRPAALPKLGKGAAVPASGGHDPALFILDGVVIIVGAVVMKLSGSVTHKALLVEKQEAAPMIKPESVLPDSAIDDSLSAASTSGEIVTPDDQQPASIVKIRCLNCHTLNDESAKFCSECGNPMT